jgi:hypothetical protein
VPQTTVLAAGQREASRGTAFLYETSAPGLHGKVSDPGVAFINAQAFERRGRLYIERRAVFEAPARSLAIDRSEASETAALTLPGPFSGTAQYSKRDGSRATWGGDLRVPLPGASVSLAGPRFKSILCHGKFGTSKVESCSEEANSLFFLTLER